jgi:uncharacterized protein YceK
MRKALCSLSLLACGCGTALNTLYFAPFEGGDRVYGGVRLDAELAGQCVSGEDGYKDQGVVMRTTWTVGAVCDIPLSAAADTLTLPIVLSRQKKDEELIRSMSSSTTPPASKDGQ